MFIVHLIYVFEFHVRNYGALWRHEGILKILFVNHIFARTIPMGVYNRAFTCQKEALFIYFFFIFNFQKGRGLFLTLKKVRGSKDVIFYASYVIMVAVIVFADGHWNKVLK